MGEFLGSEHFYGFGNIAFLGLWVQQRMWTSTGWKTVYWARGLT